MSLEASSATDVATSGWDLGSDWILGSPTSSVDLSPGSHTFMTLIMWWWKKAGRWGLRRKMWSWSSGIFLSLFASCPPAGRSNPKFMEMKVGRPNRGWNWNLCSKGKQKWKWMENSETLLLQRKATARCPAGERPLLTLWILTPFHVPVRCLVTSPVTFWYTWGPNQVLPVMLLCESCQPLFLILSLMVTDWILNRNWQLVLQIRLLPTSSHHTNVAFC